MIRSEAEARDFVAARTDAAGMRRLERLIEALTKENEEQNLVSAASLTEIWQRHIADSAQLLDHVPRGTSPWLDLGSGAGFPGLTVAAIRPDAPLILVESRRRRIEWLSRMRSELDLTNCRIEGSRLEKVDTIGAGVITARAFAPLEKLLSLSARFSTAGTIWALPKGRSAAHELTAARQAWTLAFHVEQSATDTESSILIGRGVPQRRKRR